MFIMTPLIVNLTPFVTSFEQFAQLCSSNSELQFERAANRKVIIMPMTDGLTGVRNMHISGQLGFWDEKTQIDIAFDSSTGFQLPNGAIRSPDASWIIRKRWDALTIEEQNRFAPICPDFVSELRSATDRLEPLHSNPRCSNT